MKHYLTGLATGITLALAMTSLASSNAAPVTPRLIAHDCWNSGGDLFAMEVSDFPAGCGMIERNR